MTDLLVNTQYNIYNTKWKLLQKALKTSEGIGGQSTIEINTEKTIIRKKFNKDEYKYYFIEKNILYTLNHKNIIKLHKYVDDEHTLYFKYYSNGTAFKKYITDNMIKISEISTILKIFRDILDALIYLHNNNITHRDIKLENILMDEYGNHILCDFGLSRKSRTKMKKICGTYNYMAPEMWFLGKKNEVYDYKVDIFSLGALILEVVNGESMFYDEYRCRFKKIYKELDNYLEQNERKIFDDIWYDSHEWVKLRILIKRMINPNPKYRIDYQEIKTALKQIVY
jgi:serine/threonine protein kinase